MRSVMLHDSSTIIFSGSVDNCLSNDYRMPDKRICYYD
jgi:hypothetical protein